MKFKINFILLALAGYAFAQNENNNNKVYTVWPEAQGLGAGLINAPFNN